MNSAMIVAKVLGIYLVISGIFLIFKGKTLPLLLKDFFSHRALTHVAGVILVFLGGFMVVEHNVWDGTWQTWVTVLGWLVLLKGAAYILIPEQLAKISIKPLRAWTAPLGIVVIVIGYWLFAVIG